MILEVSGHHEILASVLIVMGVELFYPASTASAGHAYAENLVRRDGREIDIEIGVLVRRKLQELLDDGAGVPEYRAEVRMWLVCTQGKSYRRYLIDSPFDAGSEGTGIQGGY